MNEIPTATETPAASETAAAGPRPAADARPTLYVCHGDEGGPRVHPCRRVQEALHDAGIEYEKVIAAHGSPIPLLRKGSREKLREETGSTKLPQLKLADGTILRPSRAILAWIREQGNGASAASS
jgi:hypothetical protein